MFDPIFEKIESFLEQSAAFVWEQFEKDLAMTQDIIAHTEKIWNRLSGFFRSPHD